MSEVLDTGADALGRRVREALDAGADTARFAVGYLFLDGLAPLRAGLAATPCVEILIGNIVNRLTEEQVREEAGTRGRGGEDTVKGGEDVAATLRDSHDRAAAETALNLRQTIDALPRTEENRLLLLTLAALVAEGRLRVRLYTRGRIHSKVTLLTHSLGRAGAEGLAIVGSSNLTMSGGAHPTELNVVLTDCVSVADLQAWYGRLWAVSQDFHRELFEELGGCWALSPEAAGAATPPADRVTAAASGGLYPQ